MSSSLPLIALDSRLILVLSFIQLLIVRCLSLAGDPQD